MNKHYHLIGIGGIGMSGIAQLLLSCQVKVSGSDLKGNKITAELEKSGAKIFLGHNATNIKGAQAIVYSSAIKEDNPEVVEARRLGLPLIKRAQALAELMEHKTVITIAGSHGKTTTTSLASCLLFEAGLSPTVAIGGILKNIGTNACMGKGDLFVAEADESDGSFLYYKSKYSIITNIDHEHLDYYKDFQKEVEAFKEFINNTDKSGCVFCCIDDPNLSRIIKEYKGRYILFGLSIDAHIYPKNIKFNGLSSEFDCYYKDEFLANFSLALGGEHNISNALSVIALGLELGIKIDSIKRALSNFKGAGRRLDIKFENQDNVVIDDYAHHPTEIQATLKAIRSLKRKRVIGIFQPHRYSRTQLLLDEFSNSFANVDYLIVTDIYAASEQPIAGINAQALISKIIQKNKGKIVHFVPKDDIVGHVLKILKPGDLVITLGAGDIIRISDELADKLKNKS